MASLRALRLVHGSFREQVVHGRAPRRGFVVVGVALEGEGGGGGPGERLEVAEGLAALVEQG